MLEKSPPDRGYDRILEIIREALHETAPEADLDAVDPNLPLREQVELDSMDFLSFLVRVRKRTGISIRASDAERVSTIAGLARVLMETPAGKRPQPRSE